MDRLKGLLRIISGWLRGLTTPACWQQNDPYSREWDRELRGLMTCCSFHVENRCIARLDRVPVWIENHPYASFSRYGGQRYWRGHVLEPALHSFLQYVSYDGSKSIYKLSHPAVKADPYRRELIPVYNAKYREWRRRRIWSRFFKLLWLLSLTTGCSSEKAPAEVAMGKPGESQAPR